MTTCTSWLTEDNPVKNVLFLAPGLPYAKTVVRNLGDTLNKKDIPFTSSKPDTFDRPYLNTEHVKLKFVYCDPVEWTADMLNGVYQLFGKKELLGICAKQLRGSHVLMTDMSLVNYIIEAETNVTASVHPEPLKTSYLPEISKVHFNPPMTIVLWEDGTKTTVRCQEGDAYSDEVGLALCIAKKALGNKGNFNNVFRKWVPEEEDTTTVLIQSDESNSMYDVVKRIKEKLDAAGGFLRL